MTSPTDTSGTVFQRNNRANRQCVNRRNLGVGKANFIAFIVDQFGNRTQILTGAGPRLFGSSDHDTGQAGEFVDLLSDSYAVDEVFELNLAFNLGNNRVSMRIPVRENLTLRSTSAPSSIVIVAP